MNLYATKYEEEFQPHLPTFATAVWELLKASGAWTLSSYPDASMPMGVVVPRSADALSCRSILPQSPKPHYAGTSWAVPKYDALVTVSMRFLASLASKRMHYDLFNNPTLCVRPARLYLRWVYGCAW